MALITENMLILDAVQQGNSDAVAEVLRDVGLGCLHCAFATGETVAQAALTHGMDVEELVKRLNEAALS